MKNKSFVISNFWSNGLCNPQLSTDNVHVWLAELNVPLGRLIAYEKLLVDDERNRARLFHFARDRDHYIAGRGMLRVMLGRYLDKLPMEIDIVFGEYDKPFLSSGEVQFNLAHSGNLALYAFCLDQEVGIDIEAEQELIDTLAIAKHFFSPSEYNTLLSTPKEQQTSAFYRCWTRKEAFIKAVGEGLSYPLDAFDVTLASDEPARLLSIYGNEDEARRWSLFSLPTPNGYHAALVVAGIGKQVQLWKYAG